MGRRSVSNAVNAPGVVKDEDINHVGVSCDCGGVVSGSTAPRSLRDSACVKNVARDLSTTSLD